MKVIRDVGRDVNVEKILRKPLIAHLATHHQAGPRDSPLWYLWKNEKFWIIGTAGDSFPGRIQKTPAVAVGIVDFHPGTGRFIHLGFRGTAVVHPFDANIAHEILVRYLGPNKEQWDPRFQNLDDDNVLICMTPETVVVRDQSYKL